MAPPSAPAVPASIARRETELRRTVFSVIAFPPLCFGGLSIQPPIFHSPAVVLAVHHHRDPLELRLPAGRRAHMIYDRPPEALLQQVIGVLHQLLAFHRVGLL